MKKIRLIPALIIAILTLALATPLALAAQTDSYEGVEALITTDKDSYSASESVTVTIQVANYSNWGIKKVNINAALPSGLVLSSGSTSGYIDKISRGNIGMHEFTAVLSQLDDVPKTDAGTGLALWIVLGTLGAAGVAAVLIASKKANIKLFSMILCIVFTGAALIPAAPALAATVHTLYVDKTISMDGTDMTISAVVTFEFDKGESSQAAPKVQLAAPLVVAQSTDLALFWEMVDHADYYVVMYLDGDWIVIANSKDFNDDWFERIPDTTIMQFTVRDYLTDDVGGGTLYNGTYEFAVVAKSDNPDVHEDSELGEATVVITGETDPLP